jgi:hypothetical protein
VSTVTEAGIPRWTPACGTMAVIGAPGRLGGESRLSKTSAPGGSVLTSMGGSILVSRTGPIIGYNAQVQRGLHRIEIFWYDL